MVIRIGFVNRLISPQPFPNSGRESDALVHNPPPDSGEVARSAGGGLKRDFQANRTILRIILLFSWLFIPPLASTDSDTYPIAWSPDGVLIVSGYPDGTIAVSGETGQPFMHIDAHDAPVTALAWGLDSQWLASAGQDIRIWNMREIKLAQTLSVTGSNWQLSWNPDGTRLMIVADDGQAQIWSTVDWTLLTSISDVDPLYVRWQGEQLISDVPVAAADLALAAWSPDEMVMAGALADGKIRLWSTVSGERITTLVGRAPVVQIAYSPTGQQLMSASADGLIRIWDLTTWNEADRAQWPGTPITWSPDGHFLAWVSADHTAVEIFQAVTEPVKSPCDRCPG